MVGDAQCFRTNRAIAFSLTFDRFLDDCRRYRSFLQVFFNVQKEYELPELNPIDLPYEYSQKPNRSAPLFRNYLILLRKYTIDVRLSKNK